MMIIKASYRNENQKAKQLRKLGIVPGCVYGKNLESTINIQIANDEVKRLMKSKVKNSKVTLEIEDNNFSTLLREIYTNPVRNQIEHLSFQSLIADEKVTSTAQIVLLNKEIVSGYVQQNLFDVSYRALTAKLVEKIEIDLDGLRAGSIVRVKDLSIAQDEEIELLTSADNLVFSILENRTISKTT